MATEKLKFKIELYATYWDLPPIANVMVNGKSFYNGPIIENKDYPKVLQFYHEVHYGDGDIDKEHGENNLYDLCIYRGNKHHKQTILGADGKIEKDQVLHIKSVEIDDIDIGALVYDAVYTPEYPKQWAEQQRKEGAKLPESFKNCVNIGFNGTWKFTFGSPFYMWLLENLY